MTMALLPTANERIDAVLNIARTKAAMHADSGNSDLAYRTLLRGVRAAQRSNNSGKAGMLVRRVWATPGVKPTALGAAPALAAAIGTMSRKSKSAGSPSTADADAASKSSLDTSDHKRARFRMRPQRRGGVVVEDHTTVPAP
jgi:hypothetical protein